jgi:hypothetical protein
VRVVNIQICGRKIIKPKGMREPALASRKNERGKKSRREDQTYNKSGQFWKCLHRDAQREAERDCRSSFSLEEVGKKKDHSANEKKQRMRINTKTTVCKSQPF